MHEEREPDIACKLGFLIGAGGSRVRVAGVRGTSRLRLGGNGSDRHVCLVVC
jgi:hypothetical protein